MGCGRSKQLLVLSDDVYIEITRDLIISDNERDRRDKISRSTFRVLQMVQNKKLYSKKDQEIIDRLFFDVQNKQNKEEERRDRARSMSELRERREEVRQRQLGRSHSAQGREQLQRMRTARHRNITW